MSNIFINNYSKIDLKIAKSEYWDFTLSKNNDPIKLLNNNEFYDDNLISYIDINNDCCYSGDTIYSMSEYKWENAFNSGLTLNNIGFTGIDNGLIKFDKENITSSEFFDLVVNSNYSIPTQETRLILKQVSGSTGTYIYPLEFINEANKNSIYFSGGFYQGIFKSENNYQILPDIINDELSFDFVIKPDFISSPLDKTLNKKNSNNKGLFFYMGLRAENKFWYDYNKEPLEYFDISSTGNTSILNENTTITTNDGFDIKLQGVYNIPTDNKYLLFNRTKNGYTTQIFNETINHSITGLTKENNNLFITMNRTPTGDTAQNFNKTNTELKSNVIDDIIKNQIGFRIKDDGSIGYRTIVESCDENIPYVVEEEYSKSGATINNVWANISVRILMNEYSTCGNTNRKYNLLFYVNSKLVLKSKQLPELLFRNLNERSTKQDGVAYNISLGGGSQGLCDIIGFNEHYLTQYLLPIEQHFAGTFIGNIKEFRIFNGKYDYSKIKINNNQ